ncbi:CBF1 [Cyberlindnera jadinii]|uniref:CBF1 protein n=2 Tax=Cyberlindnera jadinii (strain ATCC 18201 / CBS 1600 / BCRC 20928 / JCM 3617 / NBRC 0987 / NRRL Y-1542) TaxID=983966 RepID=A0A0H5C2R3_CYBJN|nr:CBF1 [Cyberlindnera jadinii]
MAGTKRISEHTEQDGAKKPKTVGESEDVELVEKANGREDGGDEGHHNIDSELITRDTELVREAGHSESKGEAGNESCHSEDSVQLVSKEPAPVGDGEETEKPDSAGELNDKPAPGSADWHKQRKDNHKEVERRRRENINAGIKELAMLLPSAETNKSQILQRASEYIKRLKENEQNNIEKWTLEKLLNDQALTELTASNEKLKTELERAYREVEHWKKVCSIAKDEK